MARGDWQVQIASYQLGGPGLTAGVLTGVTNVTGLGELVSSQDTPLLLSTGTVMGIPTRPGRLLGATFNLRTQGVGYNALNDEMAELRDAFVTASGLIALTVRLAGTTWTWDQCRPKSLDFDVRNMASHGIVVGDLSVLTVSPDPDTGGAWN